MRCRRKKLCDILQDRADGSAEIFLEEKSEGEEKEEMIAEKEAAQEDTAADQSADAEQLERFDAGQSASAVALVVKDEHQQKLGQTEDFVVEPTATTSATATVPRAVESVTPSTSSSVEPSAAVPPLIDHIEASPHTMEELRATDFLTFRQRWEGELLALDEDQQSQYVREMAQQLPPHPPSSIAALISLSHDRDPPVLSYSHGLVDMSTPQHVSRSEQSLKKDGGVGNLNQPGIGHSAELGEPLVKAHSTVYDMHEAEALMGKKRLSAGTAAKIKSFHNLTTQERSKGRPTFQNQVRGKVPTDSKRKNLPQQNNDSSVPVVSRSFHVARSKHAVELTGGSAALRGLGQHAAAAMEEVHEELELLKEQVAVLSECLIRV